jgi:hypothetical protein
MAEEARLKNVSLRAASAWAFARTPTLASLGPASDDGQSFSNILWNHKSNVREFLLSKRGGSSRNQRDPWLCWLEHMGMPIF